MMFSASSLAALPTAEREALIRSLTPEQATRLKYHWRFWARPTQVAPAGVWRIWLILAGRGFGKTRCSVEWVREQAESGRAGRIALVGATASDVRDVLVDGESGILAKSPPWFRPVWQPSKGRLVWPNGAQAFTYTAEEPDRLRGKQHDAAVADELASWRYPDAWDQLMFGLRLGTDPRCVVSTTPRPTPIIKGLVARAKADPNDVRLTRGSTYENRANLADAFVQQIVKRYEGTRLGRQELYAEILDDNPGALWSRTRIEDLRTSRVPPLRRIVVGVDPAVSSTAESAETGIVVAGLGEDGHGYVLADHSLRDTPATWGNAVVAAYNLFQADRVVGEVNNGGDLVEANVQTAARAAGGTVAFKSVRASRGKQTRAEPIAALYEQGRVHHVGAFPHLEDQMVEWDPTAGGPSPDRLDALVWALSDLMLGPQGYRHELYDYYDTDDA